MWNWLALLATPVVSLTVLGLGFALVTPSCAHQTLVWLHAVHATGVLLGLCFSAGALWQRGSAREGERAARRHFVHAMAVPVALLFTLVMAAQWFVAWVLSPCAA
jgi:uncharacterized membrane protein